MKFLKQSLCVLILLMGLNCVTEAATYASAEKRAEMISSWMKERLELSKEQMSQVEALNLKYEKKFERMIQEKNGFSCMQAIRESMKEKEKELRNLFTDQQFEAYCKGKCDLKEKLKKKTQYMN